MNVIQKLLLYFKNHVAYFHFQAALDCYVNVDINEMAIGKTTVRPKTVEPKWNEEFTAVSWASLFWRKTFDMPQRIPTSILYSS